MKKIEHTILIDQLLVKKLVAQQFPQWQHLPIISVEAGGNDNRTFRLGDDLLVRLPSAQEYAEQVQKEQEWLPKLSPHITVQIPVPVGLGQPSEEYPFCWSLYQWIDGKSANTLQKKDFDLIAIAKQLALFLRELHTALTAGAPLPGKHNYFRGDHLSVYDQEVQDSLAKLDGVVDVGAARLVWQKAIQALWNKKSVWVHGDISSGNILVKDKKLTAVIDFGCMAIGDPACDLVIAWTFFEGENRDLFMSCIDLDDDTWNRAKGWALWKALISLIAEKNKKSEQAKQQLQIIDIILNKFKNT